MLFRDWVNLCEVNVALCPRIHRHCSTSYFKPTYCKLQATEYTVSRLCSTSYKILRFTVHSRWAITIFGHMMAYFRVILFVLRFLFPVDLLTHWSDYNHM